MTTEKHINNNYTFEKNWWSLWKYRFGLANRSEDNAKAFRNNVGIGDEECTSEEQSLLANFYRESLSNIAWYRKRITRERFMQYVYWLFTLIILLGVPALVYMVTAGHWSEMTSVKELETAEKAMAGITLLVSSLLALHKFVSSWMDRRKMRSQFHMASVELKKLFYDFQNKYYNKACEGSKGFAGQNEKRKLSDEFLRELKLVTSRSRDVVAAETQAYFESLAHPTFDIAGIWKTSAKGAKQAFSDFKSSDWKLDEAKEKLDKQKEVRDTIGEIDKKMELLMIEMKRNATSEEQLCNDMRAIEQKPEQTDEDRSQLVEMETLLDELHAEANKLEFDYMQLELERDYLKGAVAVESAT